MRLIVLRKSVRYSRVGLSNMCLLSMNTTTITKFMMVTVLFKMVNESTIVARSINSGNMFILRAIRVVLVGISRPFVVLIGISVITVVVFVIVIV